MEAVLGGTTLVTEENFSGGGALVVDMVAVGMAITDLIMMEAILEAAEAMAILAITRINLQSLDP